MMLKKSKFRVLLSILLLLCSIVRYVGTSAEGSSISSGPASCSFACTGRWVAVGRTVLEAMVVHKWAEAHDEEAKVRHRHKCSGSGKILNPLAVHVPGPPPGCHKGQRSCCNARQRHSHAVCLPRQAYQPDLGQAHPQPWYSSNGQPGCRLGENCR